MVRKNDRLEENFRLMKILSFITSISLKGGGPSRSVPMLVKGLAEVGIDITLMTFRSDDMNTHALEGTTAKLKVLEPGTSAKEIEEYILAEKFDIIQMQSMWAKCYHQVAQIARKHNIPYLITPRGMLEPWSLSQKKWKKKLALMLYQMKDLQRAACIFTTAEMEAQHVRDLGVKVPMSVIPNGIETDGYACRTSMDGVKKQILFLSRVHVKKGIEILIEAFSKLRAERQVLRDWSVVIVGNGEADYIESLKQKVQSLRLEECIKILPPVFGEAKTKLYQESSLFCLPSYSENFGMVIAEAMSCGVPAITTNGTPWQLLNGDCTTMGASLDMLDGDKRTGWCIELSVENLENTLREAMSMDPAALYEMGQRGSRMINENFNYRSVAKKTKQLYEWIVGGVQEPEFIYKG